MSPEQALAPQEAGAPTALSERDAEHLAALQQHWKLHRTFPSTARLAGVLGLASAADVFGVLGRLTNAGYLPSVDRRIAPTKRFFERQVLGATRARPLQLSLAGSCETLNLDDYLIDDPSRTSLHRVHGDCVREAGILYQDLVIVEHRALTRPGDIVPAITGGASRVRTLRRDESGAYFLEAANPAFVPIRPALLLEVVGAVIGVARRLRG